MITRFFVPVGILMCLGIYYMAHGLLLTIRWVKYSALRRPNLRG